MVTAAQFGAAPEYPVAHAHVSESVRDSPVAEQSLQLDCPTWSLYWLPEQASQLLEIVVDALYCPAWQSEQKGCADVVFFPPGQLMH